MNPIDNAIVLEEAKRYTNSQRIAYIESQEVILDEDLGKNMDLAGSFFAIDSADPDLLEAGKTYTVTTDSGTYKTVCKSPEANVKYIGNIAKTDGGTNGVEDTGEPFGGMLFYEDLGNGNAGWFAIFIDFQYGTHMKIIGEETIHPIDPKFLPGVCLPVVELSTEIASGENVLTEAESAAINASFDYGLPLVIKFKTSVAGLPGVEASAILEYCSAPDFVTGYSAHITLATAAPGTLIVQKNESGDFVAIFTPDNA